MQLPLVSTNDKDLSQLSTKWKSILDPVIASPITQGSILSNIQLANGTTVINHLLGRKLVGWLVVGQNALASIYDNQASNQTPQLTLSLTSSAAVTVNLMVF